MRTRNWKWNLRISTSQPELAGKCWYQWKGMAPPLPGLQGTACCSIRQAFQEMILGWIYPWSPKKQSVLQTQNFQTLFALTSTYHSSLSSPVPFYWSNSQLSFPLSPRNQTRIKSAYLKSTESPNEEERQTSTTGYNRKGKQPKWERNLRFLRLGMTFS